MVVLGTSAEDLNKAATLLRAGDLVSFPTETVYGLGGDACNAQAVAAIYAAKGRPAFNPLIVHVADIAAAQNFAQITPTAERLADAFWPGPMTLVLPLLSEHPLARIATAGLPSVAVRVPANPVAQALLQSFGGPVAAPSANPSGKISPTRAAHVVAGLGDRIAAVVDGGPCGVGLESTIISVVDPPRLLRPGGLAAEQVEAALGAKLQMPEAGKIAAPGQLSSHYAPNETVRLMAETPKMGEFVIGFGSVPGDITLSATGDLTEAAANLFDMLHIANKSGKPIAVAPIPDTGLGRAINDRLRRAAAPRPSGPPGST